MITRFSIQEKTFNLYRFPRRNNDQLQAWDAGDEYLINHVEEQNLPSGQHILILNDNFGALSCWFAQNHHVTMMTDSYISRQATIRNLEQNHANPIKILDSLAPLPEQIDLVLIKIPKNNRFLTWQLTELKQRIGAEIPVIAVNKVKEIHTSTLTLFEQYLGTTTTSLAWKKHRLVFSFADNQTPKQQALTNHWSVEGENIELINHANVYSGESLDLGARFMLQHIPVMEGLRHIIDLGCGNGVLAIKAGQLNPQARITCVDESYMAVESTKQNLINNLGEERQIQVLVNNCLDGMKRQSSFLVLCNPPFHQGHAITDHIAWQMFCDAKEILNHDGRLLVVGNRHLDYQHKLNRLFGEDKVNLLAQNEKFHIIEAIKDNDRHKNLNIPK